jgi:hypothetical protein
MDLPRALVKRIEKHPTLVSGEAEEEEEEEEEEEGDHAPAYGPLAFAAIVAALSGPPLLPALRRFDFAVWERANIEDYSESMENSEEEEEEQQE